MNLDTLVVFALLLAVIFLYWDARTSGVKSSGPCSPSWNLTVLLIASFLTLFSELAFIRWIAVEVRVFAYVKNRALLVCFLGFGMGCALSRRKPQWTLSTLAVLIQVLFVRVSLFRGYLPI